MCRSPPSQDTDIFSSDWSMASTVVLVTVLSTVLIYELLLYRVCLRLGCEAVPLVDCCKSTLWAIILLCFLRQWIPLFGLINHVIASHGFIIWAIVHSASFAVAGGDKQFPLSWIMNVDITCVVKLLIRRLACLDVCAASAADFV